MRTQKELNQFIVLRSNGWSLAKISKHLNIPKTTLFNWEQKNADTIHLFKYVQLEKIQEQYVPSYEEQLKDTHEHLAKIQAVLKKRDYSFMSSEFLLQMNFQLQNRLDKIRQQVPLRPPQLDNPIESLPPIGCITKDETFPNEGDFSDPDPTLEADFPGSTGDSPVPVGDPPTGTSRKAAAADHSSISPQINGHANVNEISAFGVPPLGGSPNGNGATGSKKHANRNGPHRSNAS